MKKLLIPLTLSLVFFGCAEIPKTPIYGPYYQIYMDENPVSEVTYSSANECEKISSKEIQTLDSNGRSLMSSGKMKMLCSSNSVKDRLTYQAEISEVLTGRKWEARFATVDSCNLVLRSLNGKSHTINCYVKQRSN
jgi:Tfp pilus assembly major pilin PilA